MTCSNVGDNATLICMAVEELPTPYVPSVVRTCSTCKRHVWMDLNGLKLDGARIVCTRCGAEEFAP